MSHSVSTLLRKPPLPLANHRPLDTDLGDNRARAAKRRRQRHDPHPPHILPRRAHRLHSGLKRLPHPAFGPDVSRFQNQPNLES